MKPVAPDSSEPLSFSRALTIRRFLTRRVIPAAVGMIVLGGLVLAPRAFPETRERASGSEGERALPVRTAKAEPADGYVRRREFTGEVRARRTADLGFDRAARVVRIMVDEGTRVDADQPLAEIDHAKVEAERLALDARKREAQAVLAEMVAGPRTQTIAAARQTVEDIRAQVSLLEKKRDRRRLLLEQKTISDEEFDEIVTLLDSFRARFAAAEDQLGELEAGTRVERVDAQRARIEALDAQRQRLDLIVKESTLVAPFAGRILRRHVHEGTVVTPGMPVLTLVEDQVLEAWVGIPPRIAGRLDTSRVFRVAVGDVEVEARIQTRLPDTDVATRTQTVIFQLPTDAAGRVVPGQVARLQVEERVEVDGLWVPTSSLVRGVRGLWALYGVEKDEAGVSRVVRHHVEVLYASGERVFVRGTVGADVPLIVGNTERIAPGQAVAPVADEI